MTRKSSKGSDRFIQKNGSATVSKASGSYIRKKASAASHVLRDPSASKEAKSVAGSSMSQLSQVKKGGAAYHVTGIEVNSTVVATATSVHTVREGASKYRKALSRLAKK